MNKYNNNEEKITKTPKKMKKENWKINNKGNMTYVGAQKETKTGLNEEWMKTAIRNRIR